MANPKLHNKSISSFFLSLSLAWSRHRTKNETKSPISLSLNIRFHRGLLCFQRFKIYLNFFMNQHLWRRKWQPTPVLLPGKSHGRRSLVGYIPWVAKSWTLLTTSLSLFTCMHWRSKWQPTPVFLPGESQGRGSLVGCCLWGRTESDATEVT